MYHQNVPSHDRPQASSLSMYPNTASAPTYTEDEMVWESEQSSGYGHGQAANQHYLVLDTNVLLQHLNMVRTIHALLAELEHTALLLLVPAIVIRELDGLKSSSRKPANSTTDSESGHTIGQLARIANSWLLESHRTRRATGRGAVRCQSVRERHDPNVQDRGSADDEILDCSLFFSQVGTVTLWTEDKNLSVKAEIEHISTIGGTGTGRNRHPLSLSSILRATSAPLPERLWNRVSLLGASSSSSSISQNTGHGHTIECEEEEMVHHFDDDVDMDRDPHSHSHCDSSCPASHFGAGVDQEEEEEGSLVTLLLEPPRPQRHPPLHPRAVSPSSSYDPDSVLVVKDEEGRRYPYLLPSHSVTATPGTTQDTRNTSLSPSPPPIAHSHSNIWPPKSRSTARSTTPVTAVSLSRSTTPLAAVHVVQQWAKSLSAILLDPTVALLSLSLSPSRPRSSTSIVLDLDDVLPTLLETLTAIDTHLPLSPPFPATPFAPSTSTSTSFDPDSLATTATPPPPPFASAERQALLRCIAALRTINDWISCSTDPYASASKRLSSSRRTPRVGEVGDAVQVLAGPDGLAGLGEGVDSEGLQRLAGEVRRL